MTVYTTESASEGRFRAHGRVEFYPLQVNILCYIAHGPFNAELIEALAKIEPQTLRFQQQQGRWGEVVIFKGSCIGSPDTIERFAQYLQHQRRLRLTPCATAMIISDEVLGASIMRAHYQRIYQQAGINFAFCDSQTQALQWLQQQLQQHHTTTNSVSA